ALAANDCDMRPVDLLETQHVALDHRDTSRVAVLRCTAVAGRACGIVPLPVLDDGPEHRRVRIPRAGAGLRGLADRLRRVDGVSEPWGGGVEGLGDGSLDQFGQDGVLGVEVDAPPQDTDVATPIVRFWPSAG